MMVCSRFLGRTILWSRDNSLINYIQECLKFTCSGKERMMRIRMAHLRNEGCRQIHAISLPVLWCILGDKQNALWGCSDEETGRVDHFRLLHNFPIVRLLHVTDLQATTLWALMYSLVSLESFAYLSKDRRLNRRMPDEKRRKDFS